jgi:hypothetical protein
VFCFTGMACQFGRNESADIIDSCQRRLRHQKIIVEIAGSATTANANDRAGVSRLSTPRTVDIAEDSWRRFLTTILGDARGEQHRSREFL